MADPVKTPSETPTQPVVDTPAAAATPVAAVTPASPAPIASPTVETPAPDQAAAAKALSDQATADAAPAAKPVADPAVDAAAKAEAAAAAAKTAADAAAAAQIPETYDIHLPKDLADKGLKLNPDATAALTPAFKKAGLTQAQVNTVAESFLAFQQGESQRMLDRDLAVLTKDPALGGLKYAKTIEAVNVALEAFGDAEFKQFVKQSGIGNRLEFVRVFQRIGEAMSRSSDTPTRGSPDGAPETSRAERMYGRKS